MRDVMSLFLNISLVNKVFGVAASMQTWQAKMKKIAEYVRKQLKKDMMYDEISIKEYKLLFNGQRETHVLNQL